MTPGLIVVVLVVAVLAGTATLIIRGLSQGRAAEEETLRLRQTRHEAGPVAGLVIRPFVESDRAWWERHWASYCDFYHETVPKSVTDLLWKRMADPMSSVRGFGAFDPSGNLLGFAHVVLHPHTWSAKTLCYLEDLFVAQPYRGRDVGHALISFLWQKAQSEGWGRLYWHTEVTNTAARRLYDRFRPADGCVRYTLTADGQSDSGPAIGI